MPCGLKFIFVMATFSSIAFTVLSVLTISLCLLSHRKAALITAAISTFVYAVLFLCVWANLTMRLFVAFRESVYKINQRSVIGYIITFVFLLLNATAASVCQLLMLVGEKDMVPSIWVLFSLGILFMAVFSISALVVVTSFLDKLLILGKARTKKQIKVFCEEEPIGLNKMQKQLMRLSSKYISLFLMASFSSFVTMFSGFYESATDLRISMFLVPIDCCVNLICIYLQYEFAVHHYTRCCNKPDRMCKAIMTKIWVDSIHSTRRDERNIELKDMQNEIADKLRALATPTVPAAPAIIPTAIAENLSLGPLNRVESQRASEILSVKDVAKLKTRNMKMDGEINNQPGVADDGGATLDGHCTDKEQRP